jgi:hypothetical protein
MNIRKPEKIKFSKEDDVIVVVIMMTLVELRIRQLCLMNFLYFRISHDIDTLFPSAVSAT